MGGAVADGVFYNTDSGLAAPGGFLNRLTGTIDQVAQNQAQMRGLAPALQATGIPVQAPGPGILSRLLGATGLAPAAPDASGTTGSVLSSLFGGQAAAPQPAAAPVAQPAADQSPNGIMAYIGQAAQQRGINPMTAIRVAMSEGGASGGYGPNGTGDAGSSFSPFQLHYGNVAGGPNAGAGLGDDFTKATGLDARDPANAKAAIDFALDHAAQHGWSAFHGAARAGIGAFDGIGGQPQPGGQPQITPAAYAPQDAGKAQRQVGAEAAVQGAPRASMSGPGAIQANSSEAASPNLDQIQAAIQNPATRAQGLQQWGAYVQSRQQQPQPGGAPDPSAAPPGLPSLPRGLTPAALGAMIQEPATRAQGLALWQQSLTRPFTFANGPDGSGVVLREDPRSGTAVPVYQAPIKVQQGDSLYDPAQRKPVFQAPTKLEAVDIAHDDFGQPVRGSFNSQTGAVAPFAGAPGVIPNTGGGTGQAALPTGQAYLDTLPPALGNQVKALAEGRMVLPSGMGANSPIAQRLRAGVLQYDPSFDVTNSEARAKTRADFASGTTAQTINSGNTAVQHAADLSDAAEQLGNGSIPLLNRAKQAVGSATGGNIPGNEFHGALNDFASEVVKFYRSTGGTEADIGAVKANLDPSQSPNQLRAAIQQQARLISGKVSALQNQWHQGMGPLAGDYPLLAPETMAALDRINARRPTGSAYPPPGAGQPTASLPTAAPAGASPAAATPPISGARQAPDGHFYVADPSRAGKYLRVDP